MKNGYEVAPHTPRDGHEDCRKESAELRRDLDAMSRTIDRLAYDLSCAESDARVLAHAYEHDVRPPAEVVARALARKAGQ